MARSHLRCRWSALVLLVIGLFVLVGCSSSGSPLPPTPTIQLEEARQAFQSSGELTFNDVMGVMNDIVGNPPQRGDFNDTNSYEAAIDQYNERRDQFLEELKKCKLKDSIGWIGWWRSQFDNNTDQTVPNANEVVVYMDNPFSGPTKDIGDNPDLASYAWRSIALMNMTDDQVAQLKYGERIQFSGALTTTEGLVAVENVQYQAMSDDPAVPTATTSDLNGLQITLDRTACFGSCPDYHLTVSWDGQRGSVTFEGRNFTKVKGTINATIDRNKLIELVTEFQKADFFSLNDSYSANVTDNPTYTVQISTNGRSKSVQSYAAGPRRLYIVMNRIDQIVNTKQWIGDNGR